MTRPDEPTVPGVSEGEGGSYRRADDGRVLFEPPIVLSSGRQAVIFSPPLHESNSGTYRIQGQDVVYTPDTSYNLAARAEHEPPADPALESARAKLESGREWAIRYLPEGLEIEFTVAEIDALLAATGGRDG